MGEKILPASSYEKNSNSYMLAAVSPTFKPLKIGKIEIDFPVVLGALAGYSDLSYRLICRSFSAPYCTTEAMLDHQMLLENKLRRKLIKLDAADHPVAGQIMGNDPAVMAQAAAALREMGFDVIGQPDRALEIVRAVLRRIPDRPVTLKLRRALHESDETCQDFWKIARGAFDAGVAGICVHARSVDQKHSGRADWEFLSRVKSDFPDRTILGSGDVHTAADALRMIRQTGVDGVIAARGAIGNPWIFRQVRDIAAGREPCQPDIDEQRELIARHFQLACEIYGPRRGLKIMRNFGIHYSRMHPHPAKVRMACVNIKTENDWTALMTTYYADRDPGHHPDG
jgi:tRNA-dihydrouridine synthase